MENTPINQEFHESKHGRTMWDALAGTAQSKIIFYTIILLILSLIIYFTWDMISIIPIYAISSMALSLLWYNPISNWLSRGSTFIEVWDSDSNTLTTYRAGKDAFSDLQRKGITNQISSLAGSNRIFANHIDLENHLIETTFVHELDPWTYHRERKTLNRLSEKLSSVLDEIIENESTSQIQGRFHAMESMRQHYTELDKIFFGEINPSHNTENLPSEMERTV
jgi:hypothetical protein